jgi:hypothetical protein
MNPSTPPRAALQAGAVPPNQPMIFALPEPLEGLRRLMDGNVFRPFDADETKPGGTKPFFVCREDIRKPLLCMKG